MTDSTLPNPEEVISPLVMLEDYTADEFVELGWSEIEVWPDDPHFSSIRARPSGVKHRDGRKSFVFEVTWKGLVRTSRHERLNASILKELRYRVNGEILSHRALLA